MGHTKPPQQLSGHWFTTCIALLLANSNRAHYDSLRSNYVATT